MSHNSDALDEAIKILNSALKKLYEIDNLSSYQIAFLFRHYARNEELQISEDLEI